MRGHLVYIVLISNTVLNLDGLCLVCGMAEHWLDIQRSNKITYVSYRIFNVVGHNIEN